VIDLHCHILPALDDGAVDLDDSLAMARQAESDGIRIVCATPHIHPDHDIRIEELEGRVEALNEELEHAEIATRVVVGGEIAEQSLEGLHDEELRRVSLAGNGLWLLVEPRPGPLGDPTVDAVERLNARGFRSIIAHPERHPGADFREKLEALVERGALIQVTAALIADGPAAPTMLELAEHGLVHLLGSDAHSSHGGRPVRLSKGVARLAEVERLKQHLQWVVTRGPEAILNGEAALPPFAASSSSAP
jgi:protein-tyrosine phosphatase